MVYIMKIVPWALRHTAGSFSIFSILNIFECSYLKDPILVIIEYVPYGDLLGYLRKSRRLNDTYFQDADVKPETSLSSLQLMKISWQIADGMSYLSSRNVSNHSPPLSLLFVWSAPRTQTLIRYFIILLRRLSS